MKYAAVLLFKRCVKPEYPLFHNCGRFTKIRRKQETPLRLLIRGSISLPADNASAISRFSDFDVTQFRIFYADLKKIT